MPALLSLALGLTARPNWPTGIAVDPSVAPVRSVLLGAQGSAIVGARELDSSLLMHVPEEDRIMEGEELFITYGGKYWESGGVGPPRYRRA